MQREVYSDYGTNQEGEGGMLRSNCTQTCRG